MTTLQSPAISPTPLRVGSFTLKSRLIVGTGKYSDNDTMNRALAACGADVVTVAVRRERLIDAQGKSLLDAMDTSKLTILPNTAGCFTAQDAVRVARLGRIANRTLPGRWRQICGRYHRPKARSRSLVVVVGHQNFSM